MNQVYEKLQQCYRVVENRIKFRPELALVLGSGLGDYGNEMDVRESIEYSEIDGFPRSTVQGHQGRFLFGYIHHVPVVAMQGRVHYYEGYSMGEVVLPIRLMGMLGAKTIILTNAAGGVNLNFHAGDMMVITDHITSLVPSPLIGENMDELGERFPDMSQVYSGTLQKTVKQAAENKGISLQQGIYLQTAGPNYETPAEVRLCRALGADAVGMSTACEAMAAKHMGVSVCGISCITNLATGMSEQPLSHNEVQVTANQVADDFKKLITETVYLIGEA